MSRVTRSEVRGHVALHHWPVLRFQARIGSPDLYIVYIYIYILAARVFGVGTCLGKPAISSFFWGGA